MALTHRLRERLGSTEWGYRDLCIQLSKAGYRRGEPGGIPREKSERLRQSLALLRQSGVTTADIANELGVVPSGDEVLDDGHYDAGLVATAGAPASVHGALLV